MAEKRRKCGIIPPKAEWLACLNISPSAASSSGVLAKMGAMALKFQPVEKFSSQNTKSGAGNPPFWGHLQIEGQN